MSRYIYPLFHFSPGTRKSGNQSAPTFSIPNLPWHERSRRKCQSHRPWCLCNQIQDQVRLDWWMSFTCKLSLQGTLCWFTNAMVVYISIPCSPCVESTASQALSSPKSFLKANSTNAGWMFAIDPLQIYSGSLSWYVKFICKLCWHGIICNTESMHVLSHKI